MNHWCIVFQIKTWDFHGLEEKDPINRTGDPLDFFGKKINSHFLKSYLNMRERIVITKKDSKEKIIFLDNVRARRTNPKDHHTSILPDMHLEHAHCKP